MKLDTNIHHVSEHCCRGFQGQRSKVTVLNAGNDGGMHFDGVASRVSCFFSVVGLNKLVC